MPGAGRRVFDRAPPVLVVLHWRGHCHHVVRRCRARACLAGCATYSLAVPAPVVCVLLAGRIGAAADRRTRRRRFAICCYRCALRSDSVRLGRTFVGRGDGAALDPDRRCRAFLEQQVRAADGPQVAERRGAAGPCGFQQTVLNPEAPSDPRQPGASLSTIDPARNSRRHAHLATHGCLHHGHGTAASISQRSRHTTRLRRRKHRH